MRDTPSLESGPKEGLSDVHCQFTAGRIRRRYAEPVWWDIDQTDVLNIRNSRTENEERHICPLQIGVIKRAVEIWSLPGELVFSPFAGIGSEGVGALDLGRAFLGMELKRSYWEIACRNLGAAEAKQDSLFVNP